MILGMWYLFLLYHIAQFMSAVSFFLNFLESFVFSGLKKMKQVINIKPAADEETLLYTH